MTNSEKEAAALQLLDMFAPEELNPELALYVETGSHYQMIHHRLMIQVPYNETLNKIANAQFKFKKEKLQAAIDSENWPSYVFIHERPYRIEALQEVLFDFYPSDEVALSLIASVWVDSENIYQNFESWQEIWNYAANVDNRHKFLMNTEEIAALAAMPDTIEIYRGTSYESSIKGMSWTTNKKKAIWFAQRMCNLDQGPLLASAMVKKENVLAFFQGRNESEIVVDPEKIENLVRQVV
jgi:hypothetical protein